MVSDAGADGERGYDESGQITEASQMVSEGGAHLVFRNVRRSFKNHLGLRRSGHPDHLCTAFVER